MKRKLISKKIRDKILVDCMHRCCLCTEHIDITDLHHIIPISEKGQNTENNLMAICPNCHAKIHRIRGRYNVQQLKMYKNRWIELCWKKEIPLEEKIAKAPSIKLENDKSPKFKAPNLKGMKSETIEVQELSTIDYDWIMDYIELDYSDPNRILNNKCAPLIDRLCTMANNNEIYLFTKLLNNIENRWKNINQNLNINDNIKPVTSFFLDHYRILLDFIFEHNIFNDLYTQTLKSLERVVVDLISLKNIKNMDKVNELIYFNNFVNGYIPLLLKDNDKNIYARILIEFIEILHITSIKNGINTFNLSVSLNYIFKEYMNNLDDDIVFFSFRVVNICREHINHNQKRNVEFIIGDIFEVLEERKNIFEWHINKDLCRGIILIWIHILLNKKTNMYDYIKIPPNLMGDRDVILSFKVAFEDIKRFENDKEKIEIIETLNQKIHEYESKIKIDQGNKSIKQKLISSQETKRSKIFISYSAKDKQFVERLANDLTGKDLNIWLDKWEIKIGDSIVEKINEGLTDSDYFAIVMSPDSLKSVWVKEELNAAMMSIIT